MTVIPFNVSIPILLATIALCGFLPAGEELVGPPAPEPAPVKVLVRERNVYVPYEKLKETFEKEGRGIFLPYEEFLKLWNAAQPKEKPPEEIKPPTDAVIGGGSYSGVAGENSVRFEVTFRVRALGKNWSEVPLPFKNVAMESASVNDPAAIFAARGDGYVLILPKPGEYTLTLAFSVRIESKPGQRRIEFAIPQTAVSRLEITIPDKEAQVEVEPKVAATVTTDGEGKTKILAFVGNAPAVTVTWMPPVNTLEKGHAIVVASQASAVKLGERILRIDTAISYRVESNEEDLFRVKLPPDMNLLSVKGNGIREWVVKDGILDVHLHNSVRDNFALALRFERILEKTPDKLEIAFPATVGTLREDGFVTVSHDAGLRLRVERSTGLSQIDSRELPESMRAPDLLAGFRYVAHPLALTLQIETILPQIRSSVKAVIALGFEEDTLSGWVDYSISKVGIFTATLRFSNRWDVASVGDAQTIEDFQTVVEGADKVLTVNLKSKAIGNFRLPFRLTAPGRATPGTVTLDTVRVIGSIQDAGLFGVSAPKALKLTTVEREKMVSANVQLLVATGLLGQLPADFELPLAYSYTTQPASVKVSVERRQTEIRVSGMHTIIVTEAGIETMHRLVYDIAYAGTDRLAFSVPSGLDDKFLDVKCPGLKEKKKVGEAAGRAKWELLLQEKMLGVVVVDILFRENLKDLVPEKALDIQVPDVRAEDVASQTGLIAVRKESALEITPTATNLEALDPVNLPPEMRPTPQSPNVYLAYRYNQAERSLSLKLTRHVPVEVSRTVVDLMRATFVVSTEKQVTASLDLYLENTSGEQYLALALPREAVVRTASLKREEDGATLFRIASSSTPFWLRIVYTVPQEKGVSGMGWFGGLDIHTPAVVAATAGKPLPPVNKIEADLYLPSDYVYFGFAGTLHRRGDERVSNTFAWIESAMRSAPAQPVYNGNDALATPASSIATIGKLYRFQTLAAQGTLSATYCEHKLFTLFAILIFALAFAAGWIAIRRKKYPALLVCAALIVVPLCWQWLAAGDFAAIPFAIFCAGIALSIVIAALELRNRVELWREERIARAPDPFLEDAHPRPPKSPAVAVATPSAAPEPPPVQPPAPPVPDEPRGDAK